MKNTINQNTNFRTIALSTGTIAVVLFASVFGISYAHAAITSTLDLGSQGSQVTELQTYYSGDPSIYPSGLITGYFGSLTAKATQNFQIEQNIIKSGTPSTTGFGRVGPQTMARINTLMGTGGAVGSSNIDAAPIFSNVSVSHSSNSATFTWNTNEASQGQVYYDTNTLTSNEATGPRQQPYVSGAYATDNAGQFNHSITITNLQSNTTYYFLLRSVDSLGNLSMTWPSSFQTNQ